MRKLLILKIFLVCLFIFSINSWAQVSVIANKDITVDSIDKNKLKELFTLSSIELNSEEVTLLWNPQEKKAINDFLDYFGMKLKKIKKIWLKAKLTGNGTPPTNVNSDVELIETIADTPGAIGFVISSKVNDNVKILVTID